QAITSVLRPAGSQPSLSASSAGSNSSRVSFAMPLADDASCRMPPSRPIAHARRFDVPQSTAIQSTLTYRSVISWKHASAIALLDESGARQLSLLRAANGPRNAINSMSDGNDDG